MTMEGVNKAVNGVTRYFGFTTADLKIIAVGAAGVFGAYMTVTHQIQTNTDAIHDLKTAVATMDSNGTRRSHEMDTGQQLQIDENARHIADLGRRVEDMQPKLDKIDANLIWLMSKQLDHQK
jgi:hypothetical protein